MASQGLAAAVDAMLRAHGIDRDSLPKPSDGLEAGDYRDADGTDICGVCGKPKSTACIADDGSIVRFPVVHMHDVEQKLSRAGVLRRDCFFGYEAYADANFGTCDAPIKSIFEQYCGNFREFGASRGEGFILNGEKGVGKTYLAACVCNRLIEQGYRCRLTSVRAALDDKHGAMREMMDADFVVIDDFGMERTTTFGLETTYDVINKLYSVRKPMIVTTNLTDAQLKNPPRGLDRAIDRIKERCMSVEYEGANRRQGAIL